MLRFCQPVASLAFAALLGLLSGAAPARGQTAYETRVVISGLSRPTGIVADDNGDLYLTQLPTPGVPGGANTVARWDARRGSLRVLTLGEPEPTNLALSARGDLYWTCKSAGVILELPRNAASPRLFLGGLLQPSGIAVDRNGADGGTVYFTEVPMPGVAGGLNGVFAADESGDVEALNMGEPEPSDIAVGPRGDLYWTCKTAGVILERTPDGDIGLLLGGLNQPQGLAIDRSGRFLYFTEVPTPGVPGSMGGQNKVWRHDLRTGATTLVDAGDPEPSDVTVAPNGTLYWTCASAGVIVEARPRR